MSYVYIVTHVYVGHAFPFAWSCRDTFNQRLRSVYVHVHGTYVVGAMSRIKERTHIRTLTSYLVSALKCSIIVELQTKLAPSLNEPSTAERNTPWTD